MIHIVCVQTNNYLGRGKEYVNKLYDMLTRNISSGTAGAFYCLTDDADGLHEDIKIIQAPEYLSGWFNKLYLFKDGLFPDGDQVFFFDLDTIIVGCLDEFLRYRGQFALLRDFYRPQGYGSGVMSWQAGRLSHIWRAYEDAGYPDVEGGDQAFIELVEEKPELLQNLFNKSFVSYKAHCHSGIPKGAKVVCFHGLPRPHEVNDEWVGKIWKVGGDIITDDMQFVGNTTIENIKKHIDYALCQNLPCLESPLPAHHRTACIVGGAPSINECADTIKALSSQDAVMVALNGSWKWLKTHGIEADIHVMLDARAENIDFVPDTDKTELWYASQCHPSVIDTAKKKKLTLWHAWMPEIQDEFNDFPICWVGSGTTVGLRAIILLYMLGFRKFQIFGYDSSYSNNYGHGYPQALNDGEKTIDAEIAGRKFKTTPWMVNQVEQFLKIMEHFTNMGCEFVIHGDGLLQYAVKVGLQDIIDHGDIVEIDGVFWPKGDFVCREAMANTVSDISHYLTHCNKTDVVVQAGGNVGMFPKELAKHFGTVYSFEPDELNAECFIKNVKESNVIFKKAALGDAIGKAGIKRVENNCGAAHLVKDGEIEVTTIDALGLDVCDLIQLDIEGYELKALKGAINTIQKCFPVIVLEQNGLSARYGDTDKEIDAWMDKNGYSMIEAIHRDRIYKHREK